MYTAALMFLWLLAGGSCGVSIAYSRRSQRAGPPYTFAWIVYGVAMALCIGACGLIWEVERILGESMTRNIAGFTIFVLAFFTPIVIDHRRHR